MWNVVWSVVSPILTHTHTHTHIHTARIKEWNVKRDTLTKSAKDCNSLISPNESRPRHYAVVSSNWRRRKKRRKVIFLFQRETICVNLQKHTHTFKLIRIGCVLNGRMICDGLFFIVCIHNSNLQILKPNIRRRSGAVVRQHQQHNINISSNSSCPVSVNRNDDELFLSFLSLSAERCGRSTSRPFDNHHA